MPTGYTSAVADGSITILSAFAMRCARAFGATITMRDDPVDAPIPDAFEPASYYRERRAEAEASLARLRAMSPTEIQREMQQKHSLDMADWRERTEEDAIRRVRYKEMISKVEAWQEPTPDHAAFKSFMLEQLANSLRFDCGGEGFSMPRLQRWPDWLNKQIAQVERLQYRYAYHEEEDIRRAKEASGWVRDLRASLPQ